ncbi:MBL fold metallo-hydrolase [Lactobacillus delbrueckii subsp. lactis]|jgi:ribonuclease J|uniref:MBL fold metallo-hydrolase n=2 Tax=Lactobacillus delbrueckii TaxID=1584 RepID=A0A2I1S911_9LACO|nr:MBL fold metallo-hydrolase [Lactobacillus delbrueckii]APP03150.1 MBL fold metallo-hydrolase [Lactobacillus delbrueckii subsp. indicus]KNE30680.1 metallo-beta-lactamase [Lactobacillus delbrueckii subsp. indicus]MBO1168908.1 MBL fold metallo-hydrolase [Lactobacillus delbrueckii subsp. lactis]MBO1170667.1 MBL fold metallo-hydrolase [Lactobacillus delbrueckii subsp. lactis]MBO1172401.1 MBL fold metallo-hydrolase [Lactobacillus delbrueckii subsp. lactis]
MTLRDKTTVTFYNGLTTIGGPMIEVAYNDSHVLFDLGEVYRPELGLSMDDEDYQTLIKYQLIGEAPDFYDEKITGKAIDTKRWKHSAAYISHLHLDHSKALNLLSPTIPLYAGPITAHLLPALNEKGDFLLPAAGHEKGYTRPIIAAEYKKPIKVGEITMEIWPSDHDAYGATGLIVKTPDKKISFTGDIRLHGYHPDWVHEFLAASKGADLFITEATGSSWPERKNEKQSEEFTGINNEDELTQEVVRLQKANPKRQITFNTYPTNVERLLRIISDSPRKVVLHAKRAHLLHKSLGKEFPYYYLPEEPKFADLNPEPEVSYQDLLNDDHEFLWQAVADFDQLMEGGLYIHSNAEPLGDFDPAYKSFVENFAKHNVEYKALRCSGHADEGELQEIISEVQPAILVPVHTLHPELVENPYGKRILPKRGQSITL